jgi:hypothetical protein
LDFLTGENTKRGKRKKEENVKEYAEKTKDTGNWSQQGTINAKGIKLYTTGCVRKKFPCILGRAKKYNGGGG